MARQAALSEPDRIEQAVPLSDQAIQIRKRRNVLCPLRGVISNDSEPQPKFRQAYCGRTLVHPKQVLSQHSTLPAGEVSSTTRPGQPFEAGQEKRPRAYRRVQDAQRAEDFQGLAVAIRQSPLRECGGAAEPLGQQRNQGSVEDLRDERGRRVESSGSPPLIGIHDALEHPSQHVRGNVAVRLALGDGEVKALEEEVEGVPPELVR